MVQNTGETIYSGTFKPVNTPEEVCVHEDAAGSPAAVVGGRRQKVATVEDRWRIDDEWWRSVPVSRLYYSVLLVSGQRLILYKDLADEKWYRQKY